MTQLAPTNLYLLLIVTGIELVAKMCHARLKGANIGSTEVEFIPGKIRGGQYVADTKTAG